MPNQISKAGIAFGLRNDDDNKPSNALRQPWRAVWPANNQSTSTTEYTVLYGYQKGAKMTTQGSAGESSMRIQYDTGAHYKQETKV
ncbi:uncharacterized protein LTR77_004227 [Saxophila tyrrhenica]|uniref:Uncharacterized protein n=1 Tax=Saxophila tyrrhenica TaxID=1690608 RepID=A0AAV9PG44_9PEZI|nr:hypothetical protein LTR77_004227 [Saxophila tyrrhenica]